VRNGNYSFLNITLILISYILIYGYVLELLISIECNKNALVVIHLVIIIH